jgi:hypothetical protein
MSDQPLSLSKQKILENTADRIRGIISQEMRVEEILRLFPDYPKQEKEEDRKTVLHHVPELESFFELLFPHIKNIRSYISKVTDQNRVTACYFLFGKVSQSFRALFLLAREGFSYEVVELSRGIRESLDLIHLFLEEEENAPNLKKRFLGQIIENSIARKAKDKFINQGLIDNEIKTHFRDMQDHAYRILSSYSHISYSALLDSFDVYNRDFDYERIAAFHYMRDSGTPMIRSMLESTILTFPLCCFDQISCCFPKRTA